MAKFTSPLNPWLRNHDSPSRHYGTHDEDEAEGLLGEADGIARYESSGRHAYGGPRLGDVDPPGEHSKFKSTCSKIFGLLATIVALVVVVLVTSPKGESQKPGATGPLKVGETPILDERPIESGSEACAGLNPATKTIISWVEGVAGYKLQPLSCFSMQDDASLQCPLPVPVILPPPPAPAAPSNATQPAKKTRTKKRSTARTNSTHLASTTAHKRRLDKENFYCRQVQTWLEGYKNVFINEVPTCATSLIGTLEATVDTAPVDILGLELFGLPQIQEFEKFKLHPDWFHKIQQFGGGVGMGFKVYCGEEKLISAGCGTGGGYDPTAKDKGERKDSFHTGYGGGVRLEQQGPEIGLEDARAKLPAFFDNLKKIQGRIRSCPKGLLRVSGGSSFGGDVTTYAGKKFTIGWKAEGWSAGAKAAMSAATQNAARVKAKMEFKKENGTQSPDWTPNFEGSIPDVEGLDRPLFYSKRTTS